MFCKIKFGSLIVVLSDDYFLNKRRKLCRFGYSLLLTHRYLPAFQQSY